MPEMIADKWQLWTVILGLGLTTFVLRFSFLGLIGNRQLPPLVRAFVEACAEQRG